MIKVDVFAMSSHIKLKYRENNSVYCTGWQRVQTEMKEHNFWEIRWKALKLKNITTKLSESFSAVAKVLCKYSWAPLHTWMMLDTERRGARTSCSFISYLDKLPYVTRASLAEATYSSNIESRTFFPHRKYDLCHEQNASLLRIFQTWCEN